MSDGRSFVDVLKIYIYIWIFYSVTLSSWTECVRNQRSVEQLEITVLLLLFVPVSLHSVFLQTGQHMSWVIGLLWPTFGIQHLISKSFREPQTNLPGPKQDSQTWTREYLLCFFLFGLWLTSGSQLEFVGPNLTKSKQKGEPIKLHLP